MDTSPVLPPEERADCTCVHRKTPCSDPLSYPQWKVGEDNAEKLRKYGYFVVRGLLTNQEVEETKREISKIVSGWYERQTQSNGEEGLDWEEIANRLDPQSLLSLQYLPLSHLSYSRLPEVKEGTVTPSDPELAIRRLFRMSVHNKYFSDLCRHHKIVPIISELLGPDVKLLQSMSLLKPPGQRYLLSCGAWEQPHMLSFHRVWGEKMASRQCILPPHPQQSGGESRTPSNTIPCLLCITHAT